MKDINYLVFFILKNIYLCYKIIMNTENKKIVYVNNNQSFENNLSTQNIQQKKPFISIKSSNEDYFNKVNSPSPNINSHKNELENISDETISDETISDETISNESIPNNNQNGKYENNDVDEIIGGNNINQQIKNENTNENFDENINDEYSDITDDESTSYQSGSGSKKDLELELDNDDVSSNDSVDTNELLRLDPLYYRLTKFLKCSMSEQNITDILADIRDELRKINSNLKS